MKACGKNQRRGAALLLTLWCVSVVAIAVVAVARLVDLDTSGESTRARRFEARELALTGVAHGFNPQLKRDASLLHQQLPDGTKLDVHVGSESGRLNINLLLKEPGQVALRRLFAYWGVPDAEARVAIDSLADWIDPGDLKRLNGAESGQLQGQSVYALPANRDFLSVAEMRRVRGMDAVARHRPDWDAFFSVYSVGKVDLQDGSADALVAAGLSPGQARQVVELRQGPDGRPDTKDDIVFESIEQVARLLGWKEDEAQNLAKGFGVAVEPARIESVGQVGGLDYHIAVVAHRQDGKAAALNWEER